MARDDKKKMKLEVDGEKDEIRSVNIRGKKKVSLKFWFFLKGFNVREAGIGKKEDFNLDGWDSIVWGEMIWALQFADFGI